MKQYIGSAIRRTLSTHLSSVDITAGIKTGGFTGRGSGCVCGFGMSSCSSSVPLLDTVPQLKSQYAIFLLNTCLSILLYLLFYLFLTAYQQKKFLSWQSKKIHIVAF